ASKASANGLSVTVHAIGDKAVHDILDVYEAVRQTETGRPLRHRIEHVQVYHPMDRNRLAELNVIASMQPVHAASDMQMADAYWGERAQYSYAWRDMLNSGAVLVFGSDFPVEQIDPLLGIYAAVTRRPLSGDYAPEGWYPEQALTMEEAIRAFTEATAVTSGQAHQLGTITAGKLADLTIFDRDLFAIDPEEIRQTKVIGTMVGGVFKYRSF
ncbi:MAG: amidohydrolase family protein, partial [Anaerolineales bacterium]|nr:amidohydrolase family protein [Anaerolineales bacterium]